MRADPAGTEALLDGMRLPYHGLALGGTLHKRLAVPPEIPERLRDWYCVKEMYVSKIAPDFRTAFSERILRTVREDYKAMAPLYRLLRGYCDEAAAESPA